MQLAVAPVPGRGSDRSALVDVFSDSGQVRVSRRDATGIRTAATCPADLAWSWDGLRALGSRNGADGAAQIISADHVRIQPLAVSTRCQSSSVAGSDPSSERVPVTTTAPDLKANAVPPVAFGRPAPGWIRAPNRSYRGRERRHLDRCWP